MSLKGQLVCYLTPKYLFYYSSDMVPEMPLLELYFCVFKSFLRKKILCERKNSYLEVHKQ